MPQGSFTHHVTLPVPPADVFATHSTLSVRHRWARIPDADGTGLHTLDFVVGGTELIRGSLDVGNGIERILVQSTFLDFVPSVRIVAATVTANDQRRTASLVTTDFLPSESGGTELRYSEHVVILLPSSDGSAEVHERRGGTRLQLNGLAATLG